MLWRIFAFLFTLRPSDLNTTLTYVLMGNFCPCFEKVSLFSINQYLNFKIKIKKSIIENNFYNSKQKLIIENQRKIKKEYINTKIFAVIDFFLASQTF